MADSAPVAKVEEDSSRFKQHLGIVLCAFYALIYGSFVALSVYDVTLMDTLMPFGVNLAVFFGLGLIVLALILAMIYSRACTVSERNARQTAAADNESR